MAPHATVMACSRTQKRKEEQIPTRKFKRSVAIGPRRVKQKTRTKSKKPVPVNAKKVSQKALLSLTKSQGEKPKAKLSR